MKYARHREVISIHGLFLGEMGYANTGQNHLNILLFYIEVSMSSATDYDVVIIGAGIVGLIAALALCESNLRIAIVDQKMPSSLVNAAEIEQRVSAVAPV